MSAPAPASAATSNTRLNHEHIALVLQGGGALCAYRAGVYEELASIPTEPHWVAGVSIGAINAALIVGNPPARRVERLREFWHFVSSDMNVLAPLWDAQRIALHRFSAAMSAAIGVRGFYRPWTVSPMLQPDGTAAATSLYDTAPLRATLERLVDFDLINSGEVRLSVGAVNVCAGDLIYFDNTMQRIESLMRRKSRPQFRRPSKHIVRLKCWSAMPVFRSFIRPKSSHSPSGANFRQSISTAHFSRRARALRTFTPRGVAVR